MLKVFLGLVFFTLLTAQNSFSESLTLHILGDDKAQPKNWLDSDDRPQGIIIDILSEITERTGISFTYELAPWNRAYNLSAQGSGAIIGLSYNKERALNWDYSVPMFYDELVIVTTKEKEFEFTGIASLKGKRLAIKRGTSYGDDFEQAVEEQIFEVVETTDRAGQMHMMLLDRVDAILLSPGRIALESILAEETFLQENHDNFILLSPPYKRDPNYLGIPKSLNKSELLIPINQALEEMFADGTHQKIVDRNIALYLNSLYEN
jgi:ABC-type amino acid transport substrate-binding protein